jgi:hypothetical protein
MTIDLKSSSMTKAVSISHICRPATLGSRKLEKRKLALRLEHIAQPTTDQLGQVVGASIDNVSLGKICSKPG